MLKFKEESDYSLKKRKWFSIKNVLFTYLALNKILYWFNTVASLEQADFRTAANVILSRLLNQDLLLILCVIAFFYLDARIEQKKTNQSKVSEYVIFYAVGYVMLVGITFAYNVLMILIFGAGNFYFTEFLREFLSFMPTLTIAYVVAAAAMEIKQYFKAKEKETYEDVSSGKDE